MDQRAADAAAGDVYADLLEGWLASQVDRTRRAYQGDIASFARFRAMEPADAIADSRPPARWTPARAARGTAAAR